MIRRGRAGHGLWGQLLGIPGAEGDPGRTGPGRRGQLTSVVDEPLNLGLHTPVAELHFAELVGTHEGEHLLLVLLNPVVGQRPPLCLGRLEQLGVLLRLVLVWGYGVLDDVDEVCVGCEWLFLPDSSPAPPPLPLSPKSSEGLGMAALGRGADAQRH